MTDITEGMKAPAVDLPTDGGGRFTLTDGAGQATVVFFYPKADTPGCTNEAKDFSALIEDFAAAGAQVIGVSRDPVKALDRFKAKHDLKVILGSDEAGGVTEAFGVWVEKSMYGRTYMGIERSTFLIDAGGTVRRIWRSVKVKDHAQDVLEATRGL
ncbi:peroxiredoxin [Brevundimonas sp.]|jgi:peroxiredoxin Q/BCP|uniref:peroxiredoxin n=1 Tax=Brevundimonas sp. TaxID=1871086 RepID=UPI002E111916|nr:peroxiredoxin [Brevundimonas sp.]